MSAMCAVARGWFGVVIRQSWLGGAMQPISAGAAACGATARLATVEFNDSVAQQLESQLWSAVEGQGRCLLRGLRMGIMIVAGVLLLCLGDAWFAKRSPQACREIHLRTNCCRLGVTWKVRA
ncbi:uncharacterized protein M421DRAFT_362735 [Didymella exigua CBS 183.55]|uniref:Uncharacterized protein n=1 Tax=Didymella exigua CBS 183.55 TaxID=1150837 RepID=A0A6A5RXC4_9PLEO|nr:uncharacterized protein M421DRAFT_362735 [Didymella exigua CBS 183.55]KAF1930946.1 hypothetical protein M421DRAFT_362735 [Didymella exigua CBS 183.55]